MAVILNKSSCPTDEVKALATKVVAFFRYHRHATVEVRDEEEWGRIGHGVFHSFGDRIIVWMPRGTMYPFRDLYKKRAGDKLIQCWQDLFVCILAHELRHCDQKYMRIHDGGKFPQYEVDAERYAFKVFDIYRAEIDGPVRKAA